MAFIASKTWQHQQVSKASFMEGPKVNMWFIYTRAGKSLIHFQMWWQRRGQVICEPPTPGINMLRHHSGWQLLNGHCAPGPSYCRVSVIQHNTTSTSVRIAPVSPASIIILYWKVSASPRKHPSRHSVKSDRNFLSYLADKVNGRTDGGEFNSRPSSLREAGENKEILEACINIQIGSYIRNCVLLS